VKKTESSGISLFGSSTMIVVSNRLPVEATENEDGSLTWGLAPGGLVTALEPLIRENTGTWVGWAGVSDLALAPFQRDGMTLIPVTLSKNDVDQFYEGFSNDTLWPLYHDVIEAPSYHRTWWDVYCSVNQRFAQVVAAEAAEGATVWVHDYQLQQVPQMLRELRPDLIIGFFLHIPFPAYGLFSQLPWRRQIIEGLLGADLVGFQRQQDADNFIRIVRRIMGFKITHGRITVPSPGHENRCVVAQNFPISISYRDIQQLNKDPDVIARAREIRESIGSPKLIYLGADRLDYTKGFLHRLKAFDELLADGDLDPTEVVMVMVASPSRERVESYMKLRDDVELAVGRINGQYGELGHAPVVYLHHNYPREEMMSLFLAADVMLVTPLRDGMNLVAKEFVAARSDGDGVLVLSEFAGAFDELKAAVAVNPHDIDDLKKQILRAKDMAPAERRHRMLSMRRRVREHDVEKWSRDFLKALAHTNRAR
jgi:alpha,alpha-trehalose-phosphate synthase [UDP-forming]